MQTRTIFVAVAALMAIAVTASEARVLHSADEAEFDDEFDLATIMEMAVDSVLAAQGAAEGEAPSRRALYEVALARAVRERATRDSVLQYNKEKAAKTKALAELRDAERMYKKGKEANKATINKLQSQKAQLERENRSLQAACLKSTHLT